MNNSFPDMAVLADARPAGGRLAPVDLSPYAAGNTGIPFVTTWDSGSEGPHLAILALTHGNEVCGAHALDHLFKAGLRPRQGRLTLAFANIAAHATYDPRRPVASRYLDEDFNRVWSPASLDGNITTRELQRARALRPLMDSVDHLLDLHSMQTPSPPLALAGTTPKGVALCRRLGAPAHVIVDAGHADGVRLRDYAGFGDPASGKSAVLVECGQHEDPASRAVAIDASYRFLRAFDAVDAATAAPWLRDTAPLRVVTVTDAVTVRTTNFRFTRDFLGMEVVPQAGTPIAIDGDVAIHTPYDHCVLVMPSRRQRPGQTAVRFGRFTD